MVSMRFSSVAFILLLVACKQDSEPMAPRLEATPLNTIKSPPLITKADWQAALNGTYIESSSKTDEDGVTEFSACFEQGKQCDLFTFGKRDEFRKITFFTPPASKLNELGGSKYLHSYISLKDCQVPSIVLNARFFSKDGWLFMNNISILADGDLVIDQSFIDASVKRENESYGVIESATWLATEQDIAALRKIVRAKTLIIRTTGDKGYITMDKGKLSDFRSDMLAVTTAYDKLQTVLREKIPADCL